MKELTVLLLRSALGIAFLSAVADRLGYWGPPESPLTAWGNWDHFSQYTSSLTFGASGILLLILAVGATFLEVLLGIFLILGYKIKQTAFCSGVLLLIFATGMALNTHIKYTLDYSVFSACFGAFLLAYQPFGKWSVDHAMKR